MANIIIVFGITKKQKYRNVLNVQFGRYGGLIKCSVVS